MKARDLAAAFALGLAAGAVVPLPDRDRSTPEPGPAPAPASLPRLTAPAPQLSEDCVDPTEVESARRAAEDAAANARAIRDAFYEDWGRPPEPPAGEAAIVRALWLNDQLAPWGQGDTFLDVSCDLYPCTVVVASEGSLDLAEIAEAAGIRVEDIHRGSIFADGRNHPMNVFAVVDAQGLDADERRWTDTLMRLHQVRASGAYVDRLHASAAEPEP